LNISKDKNNS